jgi:hypothetical protein
LNNSINNQKAIIIKMKFVALYTFMIMMVAVEGFSAVPVFVRSHRPWSFALKTAADDQVNDIKKEFSDLQHKLFNELEAKKVSSQHGVVRKQK